MNGLLYLYFTCWSMCRLFYSSFLLLYYFISLTKSFRRWISQLYSSFKFRQTRGYPYFFVQLFTYIHMSMISWRCFSTSKQVRRDFPCRLYKYSLQISRFGFFLFVLPRFTHNVLKKDWWVFFFLSLIYIEFILYVKENMHLLRHSKLWRNSPRWMCRLLWSSSYLTASPPLRCVILNGFNQFYTSLTMAPKMSV